MATMKKLLLLGVDLCGDATAVAPPRQGRQPTVLVEQVIDHLGENALGTVK
jgi:hypothetical protein